ncbi:MAG TPA: serine acetyltransferase [Spirochaetota bacterium]|nr:serine acetyltransferase [Spirochaetota bacterium]HPV43345.1 serine acetyltransferase [Spirochaetota bacterium]
MKCGIGAINDRLTDDFFNDIVGELCRPESYQSVYHRTYHDFPMPSVESLREFVDLIKSILFPGYFVNSDVKPETMKFYIGSSIDIAYRNLAEQVKRGFCFSCAEAGETDHECEDCERKSKDVSRVFLTSLPRLRRLLTLDAQAAYHGDPAAKGVGETIFCYPSLSALANHRIAHELYCLDVPLIPRIISEMAHSETGIDIHPGAKIGESFFIDHGTGTVIGETAVIGNNVRIYQGVTLGAKSFPLDSSGSPIKGIPRHPIVEDDVIIYSGATILGRVTIGKGAEIGGNVWLTRDVAPGSHVMQSRAEENFFGDGLGI